MFGPFTPAREGAGRVADGFAPVELSRRRDVDPGRPLGELLVRDRPGLVWSFCQTLVEAVRRSAGVSSK